MSQETKENSEQFQGNSPFPLMDPRMIAAMYGGVEEDEIDLFKLCGVIWQSKWVIISVSFVASLLATIITLQMPNVYRAEVVLSPAGSEGGKSAGLSSALGGLGGLASMAGISLGGGGSTEENLAVLQSRQFIWKFVQEKKIMPVLFAEDWDAGKKAWVNDDLKEQPTLWNAYRLFRGSVLSVKQDKKSGLVTVGVAWTDSDTAAQWANELIARLNAYSRDIQIARSRENLSYLERELGKTVVEEQRQALFELISQEQKSAMFANTQSDFAFRVLDAAVSPDMKFKPKRSLIVILATLSAGMLAVIFVFVREAVKRRMAT